MTLALFLLHVLLFMQQQPSEILDGYSNKISVLPGDSVELYLNAKTAKKNHALKLYDLSRKEVLSVNSKIFPQSPANENPFENGYGYRITTKIKVPELPSGIYLWENQIPFIIKSRSAKITVVYPSNTNNAYCAAGGKSLYGFNSTESKGARKVSFLRPMPLPRHSEAFFRWLHQQPLKDIRYVSDLDLDDYSTIKRSDLLILAGHSEYWTLQARKNFDRFVNEGKNAMILSGNTMWWQVRYNASKDQLICYRHINDDPIKSPRLKTITWCEPSLRYPIYTSTGTDFQNAGYGLKKDNGWNGYKIVVNSPLLAKTTLKQNEVLSLPSDETDGAPLIPTENGNPIIDRQKLAFEKIELIGYDLVSRGGNAGVATWIVFKPGRSSGIVINTASTDWCSSRGIGVNRDIQQITTNMISMLLKKENVFSEEAQTSIVH